MKLDKKSYINTYDINDSNIYSILHYAAELNEFLIVDYLLSKGFNANIRNS